MSSLADLRIALQHRLDVIANHALRDADPAAHLEQLKEASEAIERLHQELGSGLHPQLNHFLESQSYHKALAVLNAKS